MMIRRTVKTFSLDLKTGNVFTMDFNRFIKTIFLFASVAMASAQVAQTNIQPVIANFTMNQPYRGSELPTYFSFDITNLQLGHSYMLQEPSATVAVVNGHNQFVMDFNNWISEGSPSILLSGAITNYHFGPVCSTNVAFAYLTNRLFLVTNVICNPSNPAGVVTNGTVFWPPNRLWRVVDLSATNVIVGH